ncbi:unnamed protein product [Linum trigynum]|uniref:Uncharacterized protein n=1 Tax=Linum trigynum TaxID=586398 RepID=A0AAV2CXE6_9ROSI
MLSSWHRVVVGKLGGSTSKSGALVVNARMQTLSIHGRTPSAGPADLLAQGGPGQRRKDASREEGELPLPEELASKRIREAGTDSRNVVEGSARVEETSPNWPSRIYEFLRLELSQAGLPPDCSVSSGGH